MSCVRKWQPGPLNKRPDKLFGYLTHASVAMMMELQ